MVNRSKPSVSMMMIIMKAMLKGTGKNFAESMTSTTSTRRPWELLVSMLMGGHFALVVWVVVVVFLILVLIMLVPGIGGPGQ
jgi:hypothetical protein